MKRLYYIVLAVITLACNILKTHQIEINEDTPAFNALHSVEKFIEDLYDNNKEAHVKDKPTLEQKQVLKNMDQPNVSSSVVLMMKLISYYEDKFKVASHEPTERGKTERIQTKNNKLNNGNKVIQRIGITSKNNYDMSIPEVVIA